MLTADPSVKRCNSLPVHTPHPCPAGSWRAMNKAADGGRIGKANGGLSHAAGYSPVLGNNRFGYPSGGVTVRTPVKGGGVAKRGMGRAFMKGGRV